MSKIKIGQKVICSASGIVGTVIKFYYPTASEEQTMVLTTDGRQYHAPTRTWYPYTDGLYYAIVVCDEFATFEMAMNTATANAISSIDKILNPYGAYVARFAHTHGISVDEAYGHPMCKARLKYFNAIGQ